MRHSGDSPETEVHRGTGVPKKDRNISNNQPNPTSARTGGIITSKAQSEQKEGKNQDQSRSE